MVWLIVNKSRIKSALLNRSATSSQKYVSKRNSMIRNLIASQFKKPTGLVGMFTSNLMIKGNRNNYDTLIKDLDVRADDKILEIGYGPGIGINLIAGICKSCTIHGIDFSKLMYRRANELNRKY